MSIRVNPNVKLFPHAIQDMHDFILLLNMYKHFKDTFSALWVYAMWMQRVDATCSLCYKSSYS